MLGKAAQIPMPSGRHLNPFALEQGVAPGWISFCKFCSRHGMM